MKNKIITAMGAGLLLLLLSCGSTSGTHSLGSVDREAIDVPLRFEFPEGAVTAANTCSSPLTDPRDGTQIIMQSSFAEEGVGDYVVPSGKYGVKKGELLRVRCATGEVVGIVKR